MKEYNFNSPINQKIKGRFVEREVLACISDMADHLFSWDGDTYAAYDEFHNFFQKVCPECGSSYGFEEDGDDDGNIVYKCCSCEHAISENEYSELDDEPQEVYEWWIVTPWFGGKLKSHKEVVLERWGGWIWGRCCTGQAILLDGVISDICYEMEILDGQTHAWEKADVE